MLASFWMSKSMLWISKFAEDHLFVVQSLLILIAMFLIPRSWNERSDKFEKNHKRLLWVIIIFMFLLIPLVYFFFH
jgi:hypothetical protein